jgi:hypothetical protein
MFVGTFDFGCFFSLRIEMCNVQTTVNIKSRLCSEEMSFWIVLKDFSDDGILNKMWMGLWVTDVDGLMCVL